MFWGFRAYREWNIIITHFNPSTKKECLNYLEGQSILTDLLAINFLGYHGSNLAVPFCLALCTYYFVSCSSNFFFLVIE